MNTAYESSSPGSVRASQRVAPRRPLIREQLIFSYGGKSVRTHVAIPANRHELRGAFEYARERNWRVTFRGGGHAFDSQSLNDRLVISMEKFRRIEVDHESRTVTAEGGAQWGDVLAATTPHRMLPYVMVTTHTATVGGTLSSDSLSRFSPTLGREGLHVERFSLMTPKGDVVECSRRVNAAMFRTVIGGLGYVGAILSVTHRLLYIPGNPNATIVVKTQFTKDQGLESIAASLLSHLQDRVARHGSPAAGDTITRAIADPVEHAWAVSAVVYLTKSEKGLIATSRYVDSPPATLRRSVYHSPNSPFAWALQIAALVPFLRNFGYWLAFLPSYADPYVDPVPGYTFFEDGNRNVREVGRAIGLPMGIHQHTFVVPFDPAIDLQVEKQVQTREFKKSALAQFFVAARDVLNTAHVSPTLIDVLYLPDDGGFPFALSSSRNLPGFAVTFTFEKALSTNFDKEKLVLQRLAAECKKLGGRVHLVKNVDVDSAQVADEYGEGLAQMRSARKESGATSMVSNDFMRRVLGPDEE